jgi:hypothetical protein
MSASNIHSVDLNNTGSVTIHGTFTDMADRKVTLLHIWLAQPGTGEEAGVGLATDVLSSKTVGPHTTTSTPAFDPDGRPGPSFELESFGAGDSNGDGDDDAQFRPGPAVVSAIAVVSPVDSKGPPAEVLEWSRMLTLPQRGYTEAGDKLTTPSRL